jgi:hypothetical protein
LGLSIVNVEHHKHQFQHIFGTTTVNEKAELQFDISACSTSTRHDTTKTKRLFLLAILCFAIFKPTKRAIPRRKQEIYAEITLMYRSIPRSGQSQMRSEFTMPTLGGSGDIPT